jgi:uncharacterized protein
MEGKNSGSRAGKFRYYRRKRRGTHRRSHSGFSSNARSETFSGCHAVCSRKLCSRRFLGILKLELQWIGDAVRCDVGRLGSRIPNHTTLRFPNVGQVDLEGAVASATNLDLLIEANRAAHQSGGENTQSRLFANYAKYAADKSRRATVRPAHWEYDRTLKNARKLALAGPFADDEGGLFVYNAVRREEAMSYLKQDPFALEGVFADCELLEWLIEGLNPDLLATDLSPGKE